MNRLAPLVVMLLIAPAISAAGVIPASYSYLKPVSGGEFELVVLGDAVAEAAAPAEARRQFAELRAKYSKTGLYRVADKSLVYAIADAGFAPRDNYHPAADGIHLVRIDGESWKTSAYTGGRNQLSEAEVRKQFESSAVTFFVRGEPIASYKVNDLIADSASLPQSPEHLLWISDATMNEDVGKFLIFTQDAGRVTFDYRTGVILDRSKVGLDNPLTAKILAATAGLTVVTLCTWAWFAFGRRALRGHKSTQP